MFYLIISLLLIAFLVSNYIILRKAAATFNRKYLSLLDREENLKSRNIVVTKAFKELRTNLDETFFVYELARDISPILDKGKLLDTFEEKLKAFGGVKKISFSDKPKHGYLNYKLNSKFPEYLSVESSSRKIKEDLPFFIYQLNLCLERISLYKKLQELSILDSLTQVYNRRYFMERFYEEFERAKKFSFSLSFLTVDIDYFKNLNDTYGHIVGDAVLCEVTNILKESIRTIDFVARYGGEEFSVILTETAKKDAIVVAKRIVKKIFSSKLKIFDESIKTTVSIGVASYPENTLSAQMLIEVSDKALYKAKESGRNNVSWF